MKPTKIIVGVLSGTSLVMGGVDASKLNEVPLERVEMVAQNRVEAKQIGNVVETTLPWKDQNGFKVKYDMGEPTVVEKVKDKRNKQVITETVNNFDGGFKVDILLNEKPDTNVFCYAIEGAENYDFFYQPPLTAEEIAEGASRPPEIEGSYAVYHKTLKNHVIGQENYATGKVMHIPRPQVWSLSDESTKVWADMNYDAGQLCVTVPQDFLDKAKYPVRIDPEFGYTSIGASSNGTFEDQIGCLLANSTGSGDVIQLSVYLNEAAGATAEVFVKGAIYSSTEALLSPVSNEITSSDGAAWNTVSFTSGPAITTTNYLLCVWGSDGGAIPDKQISYDTGGTGHKFRTLVYGSFPDPLSGSSSTFIRSIYVTYSTTVENPRTRINNGTLRINNGTLDL